MSDVDITELLRRRLDLVSRLSLATSQMQKWRQAEMAAQMDVQRCEAAQELQRELHEASCRSEEAESGVERCAALIDEIEQSLAETDREIESARSVERRR